MTDIRSRTPLRRAFRVAAIYLLVAGLWILFSDIVVEQVISDAETMSLVQTSKGWAFITLTSVVLFLAMVRQLRHDRRLLDRQLRQQEEIRQLGQFQQNVIDNANIWINVVAPGGRVLIWNRAAESISGYPSDEVIGSDRIWEQLYPDADYRARILGKVRRSLASDGAAEGLESTILTRNNGERVIAWNSRTFSDADGQVAGSIAIGTDITERKAAELALKSRERQLTTLMDNLPGMAYRCLYDPHWTMKFVSSGCRDLTGYQPGALTDNRHVCWADLLFTDDSERRAAIIDVAIGAAEAYSVEYRLRRADGQTIWVWERGRGVDEDGALVLEGIILDITERKELEYRLSELAALDPVTGQFNRRETERILAEEVVRAERYGRKLAVLWLDLDHFKQVNDTRGHSVGDEVLRAVSLRLAESIRTVDMLGRFGGEEFLVVLPEMAVEESMEIAERLRRRVAEEAIPVSGGEPLWLTVSIGAAVYPDHADSAESLCRMADQAMYQAKQRGRNRAVIVGDLPGEPPGLSDGP